MADQSTGGLGEYPRPMRHYEVMVILDPSLEERTIAPSLDAFLSVVKNDGGTVEKVDIWGRRRLAYEINKHAEGIYAVIDLQAKPAVGPGARPPAEPQRVGAADQGPAPGRAVDAPWQAKPSSPSSAT